MNKKYIILGLAGGIATLVACCLLVILFFVLAAPQPGPLPTRIVSQGARTQTPRSACRVAIPRLKRPGNQSLPRPQKPGKSRPPQQTTFRPVA